jgi:dipeptidyl aminopeptidase/acylaminoacyl peptidase
MKIKLGLVILLILGLGIFLIKWPQKPAVQVVLKDENLGGLTDAISIHPLQIVQMRQKDYPGSDITIEQNLANGGNHRRYIASYKSDGLKIFGLLTVPQGQVPEGGWPVIVFNHGYIPPEVYSTTERYEAYVNGFAQKDYVVFKPDYRGHGNSEGNPEGAYYSPAYTTDVLNALSSVKKLEYVNRDKIGMWGHSLGGHITLRTMVVNKDVKAGVIWAGVVADYYDMANNWRRRPGWTPSNRERQSTRPNRQNLIDQYGSFEENPDFWDSISPINFVVDISGPVQIHHGTGDVTVPHEFSESLRTALEKQGKTVEYYSYDGADHNLSGSAFSPAMQRSVAFFDTYLK